MSTDLAPIELAPPRTSSRTRWLVLGLLATAQLMLILDVTVVNVALPDIGRSLRLGQGVVPWVMTTYTLAFGGLMLLGGRIADQLGTRRVMFTGLALFTAASLVCGAAHSAEVLLAGRVTQGIGAAIMSPAALALVLRRFEGADRGRALGIWGALAGLGSALGVILGGVLTSAVGWRWIFVINVPIGVLLFATLPFVVPAVPSQPKSGRQDVAGAVLVTAGTAAAIYGFVNVGQHGWLTASTLLPLAAAIALWIGFAIVEERATTPLLHVKLLLARPVASGAFLMLVATGLMVGGFFLGSFALQRRYDYSALHVGVAYLPVALAVVTGAHTGSKLLTAVSARFVAVSGLLLATVGEAIAAIVEQPVGVVVGLSVAALGIGATFVTAFTAALADAAPDSAGLRSAVVNTFHELGGGFGVAVLASAAGGALAAAAPTADAFRRAFGIAACVAAVGVVVAAFLVPKVFKPQGHQPGH
jgi:EmrB/QacA subfamily drug resistance transporter